MTKSPDFISLAIKKHLAPRLVEAGFFRHKPKQFVRVRGELIDSIGFQLSRWGGKGFYVHRFMNLISSPVMDISSYRVGEKFGAPPDRDVPWEGPDEKSAEHAIMSVASFTEKEILPWFASTQNVRDFLFMFIANPNTNLESIDVCIAMLRNGTTNRPWWICEKLKNRSTCGNPIEEHEQQQMTLARDIQAAIASGQCEKLLDRWRAENIDKFKLSVMLDRQKATRGSDG